MKSSISLLAIFLFPGLFVANLNGDESGSEASARPKTKQLFKVKPGPWGNLEYYETYLKPPEWLLDSLQWPRDTTRWIFPGLTPAQAKQALMEVTLPEDSLGWIESPGGSQVVEGGCFLFPPENFLLGMSPFMRARAASLLSRWPQNFIHWDPIIVSTSDPKGWFSGAGISEKTASLAASLSYLRGKLLVFSDIPLVLSKTESEEERTAFTRVIGKQKTLVLRLRMGAGSDVEQISNYWSSNHRREDVVSILEGVMESGEVELLDIVHLMPPLPRKLLYTYPMPEGRKTGEMPDCYWTALNFFNFVPREDFLDVHQFEERLAAEYVQVGQPLQLGDIVVIKHTETGNTLHAASYVAEEIVFTKNGQHPARPWILMRYRDMVDLYLTEGKLNLEFYRKK
ncbi:MAG: hypothetical protein AAGJ79_14230 [Verrucomicrobiota bacterium]